MLQSQALNTEHQKQKEHLRFGQTISLGSADSSGLYLNGDGFIKTKVQLFEIDQHKVAAGCMFFQSLFYLYPSFVTSRLDQAQNLGAIIDKYQGIDERKTISIIQDLEEKVILEYKMNIELTDKTKSMPVSFTQPVQFLHLASNKFLACNYVEADIENENFKLELNEFPSSNTCFRFVPGFAHQTRSDGLIYEGDSLYIILENIYIGIKPYMHVGLDQNFYDNTQLLLARTMFNFPNQKLLQKKIVQIQKKSKATKTLDPDNIHEPIPNPILMPLDYKKKIDIETSKSPGKNRSPNHTMMHKDYAQKREANISLEQKSPFQIKIFTNYIADENLVCCGDILWLHHLESDAILVTLKNQQDDIVVSLQTQSNADQSKEFIGNTNGMWFVENERLQEGGIVEWGQPLRLRHFSLGKYLAIKTMGSTNDSDSCFYLSDHPTANSLLAFLPLPSALQDNTTARYVTKDAFFKLKAVSINGKHQWIQFNYGENQKAIQDPVDQDIILEEDVPLVMIKLSDLSKDDDVLKCYKGNLSEIQETSFLISCFPVMRKSLDILRMLKQLKDHKKTVREAERLKFPKRIAQLQKVLEDLNKFCNNQLINTQIDIKNNKKANQNRQKLLKEQYFIEILLEILKHISHEEELKNYQDYSARHNRKQHKHNLSKNDVSSKTSSIEVAVPAVVSTNIPRQNLSAFLKQTRVLRNGLLLNNAVRAFASQVEKQFYNIVNHKVSVIKMIYRLLISICRENNENERYIYQKISQFQYQAKFFKETTDFITSILGGNEQLLSNLTDDVRLSEKRRKETYTIHPPQQLSSPTTPIASTPNVSGNHVQTFAYNAPDIDYMYDSSSISRSKAHGTVFNDVNVQNNIVLFYKKMTEDNFRNPTYLEFFRTISRYKNKGISVNQEIVHKFQRDSRQFANSLFIKLMMYKIYTCLSEDNVLKVEVTDGSFTPATSIADPDVRHYLILQLQLFSDLAMGRNYLWKTYFERIFKDASFIFKQIFDQDQSIEIRSAFCNLALTVYVDREPYNPLIVPNLCRLLELGKHGTNAVSPRRPDLVPQQQEVQDSMKGLIDQTFQYIEEVQNSIKDDMLRRAHAIKSEKKTHVQGIDNNTLTLDIIKLVKTLVQFDMLSKTNQRDKFSELLPLLVQMLEYDRSNLALPYILHSIREENIRKAVESQNKLMSTFKAIAGQAVAGITDIGKFVANSINRKNGQDALEEEFAEYQTTILSKNPIISSLITITNIIQNCQLAFEEQNSQQAKVDIEIKLEICELLIFLQELRLDFLISNFICFFSEKGHKLRGSINDKDFHYKLNQELMLDIVTVIPPTLRTGIEEIDAKPKEKGGGNIFSAVVGVIGSMGKLLKNQRRFTNYCGQRYYEMQDLDLLMSGKGNNLYKGEILPSLLATMHITKDSSLLDKIIEVMRRCFSQKQELLDNLNNLEVLFDQNEINCYHYLQNTAAKLRTLTESSEVWIETMSADMKNEELRMVMAIVKNLNIVLLKRTEINNDLIIKLKPAEQGYDIDMLSVTRQKIFTFLSVHVPLINFIRDSQNQLAKILKDTNYNSTVRSYVLNLLKEIYKVLTNYCKSNESNQNILYEYIDFFIDEIVLDFGQIDLVCTIIKDNKFLCESFPDSLLETFLNFINIYGRQTRFLNIFKVIQTYKKQNLVENQIRVLGAFLPHNANQQADDFINQNEFWLYGMFVKQGGLNLDFQKRELQKQSFDQPFSYHSKLFDVLLQTTVGEESFKLNSPKLKNVFRLGYLVELLQRDDDLLPEPSSLISEVDRKGYSILKPKVVLMINWIYINNELTHHEIIIKEQHGFLRVFEKELKRIQNFVHFLRDESVDIMLFINYFFDHLIVLLTNFSSKMILRDINQEYKDREEYICLYQMCKSILDYSNHVLTNILTGAQYNNLVRFVTSVDDTFFRDNANCYSQCLKIESKQRSNSNYQSQSILASARELNNSTNKKKVKMLTIFNQDDDPLVPSTPQNKSQKLLNLPIDLAKSGSAQAPSPFNSKMRKEVKKIMAASLMAKEANEVHSWANLNTWNQFLQVCQNSAILKEEMHKERQALASSFVKIDKLIPESMRKNNQIKLEFKEILKKLIKYIEFGIVNKAKKENLIYTLEILEEILCQAEDLEEMQNLFDQHQATKMILNLIADYKSYPFDDDFFHQLLSFGCKLSEGGNQKVQKTIFNYFSNLTKSEAIFQKINSIINEHIDELKLKQKQQIEDANDQQGGVKQKTLNLQDTGTDYVGAATVLSEQKDDQSKEIQQHGKIRQLILVGLLRFLQLFCEGHNYELQNYILYQFNSRNNYNLVQQIVELLYMYHFDLTQENFENIMRCLDTLTEFVQGPCSPNQQSIIDSKFLEIANAFLSMHIPKNKKSDGSASQSDDFDGKKSTTNLSLLRKSQRSGTYRKTANPPQLKRWQLERIKYKSMVLVTSLLELNSDSLAIKRIMRSLPVEILKQNLVQTYKRYKKFSDNQYTNECLKHIEADPDDPKLNPEYHELILETGFYIYFLISYYSELDTQEIDVETSAELQGIKQTSKQSVGGLLDMRNNLIGQLISFAFAIISGILITINAIRRFIQKKIKQKIMKDDPEEQEKKAQMKREQNEEIFKETLKFFVSNSAHIEVVRNNQLEKVHFYKLPHCHYLPDETKLEFHDTVSRDSVNAKISDLVDESQKIIEICKHEEELALFFSHNKFIAIFANYVILWKDLAFLLTLLLNIFIILSFYSGEPGQSSDQQYHDRIYYPRLLRNELNHTETMELFTYFGYVMIICSTFVVVFFLCKKAPLYIREAWGQSKEMLNQDQGCLINTFLQLFTVGNCIFKVLLNIDVLYYLTYGTLAFVATIIHPFFFAFHLTEVVLRFPTLRNIIQSFWEPKRALMLTFVLIILLNYYFTLIGYSFYFDLYDGRCGSMLYCFMETFDKAFKNNGGIGGWMDSTSTQDVQEYDFGRFFFDNLYNLAIVIILIQIFSGIIIDTFSSLREKSYIKSRDIKEICFICGFTRYSNKLKHRELFDRKSDSGFVQHTKNDHYMWNYLFYISYIRDKEVTEYTGIESYIAEKLKNYDHSWFPINKAMGLSNMIVDSHHYESEKLKDIEQELSKVKKNVGDIISTVEELKSKRE